MWKAGKAGDADPVLTGDKREGLEAGVVEDAMVTYYTERPAVAEYLGGVLGRGVIGKVEVTQVEADEPGPFTAVSEAPLVQLRDALSVRRLGSR